MHGAARRGAAAGKRRKEGSAIIHFFILQNFKTLRPK